MDLAALLTSHHVLALGSVREAARLLERPASSVSAALNRLQEHIATPLTSAAGSRLQPTLEGIRLSAMLKQVADLIVRLTSLDDGDDENDAQAPDRRTPEARAAQCAIPMLALQRFLIVSRTGSIRRAALEIGIGQPQLTRQLKTLETSLGFPLLDRVAAGAVPNQRGQHVIAIGEEIEALWLSISDGAGNRFRRSAATAHIGSVTPLGRESLIARMLAELAAAWPRHMPRRPLHLSSTNAEELLAGLASRHYDLVLVDTIDMPQGISHRVLSRGGLALVGAPQVLAAENHDLRRILLNRPIALPSLKSGLRQKFVAVSRDILKPEERARLTFSEIDSIPVIANLVTDHGHVALLPKWAVPTLDERMAAIDLPARYNMQLALAWKDGPASDAVVRAANAILGDGHAQG